MDVRGDGEGEGAGRSRLPLIEEPNYPASGSPLVHFRRLFAPLSTSAAAARNSGRRHDPLAAFISLTELEDIRLVAGFSTAWANLPRVRQPYDRGSMRQLQAN